MLIKFLEIIYANLSEYKWFNDIMHRLKNMINVFTIIYRFDSSDHIIGFSHYKLRRILSEYPSPQA
jgi:hypothetical protein